MNILEYVIIDKKFDRIGKPPRFKFNWIDG